MSRLEINIDDNNIAYAEMILFGKTGVFDNERKKFIRNLETIDLQAVPGSGKTTALLAKFLILEKHLPFGDGSGILVLSHTNNAVDIIRDKIGLHCPKLFTYPNYVGTIQSFVNQFLAIPYYCHTFRKRPYRIDDEIYRENIWIPHKAKTWLDNNQYQRDAVLYESRINKDDELVIGFDHAAKFPLKDKASDTYKALLKMKQSLQEEGYLCFDDAYILANRYLIKYPVVKNFLQNRFCCVFVDEMQDMDKYQHDLLEQLFYDNGKSFSIYQRIGDKNQAIFSGEVKLEDIWNDHGSKLQITGSCRLSPSIAKTVQPFGLTSQNISGNNYININGLENNLPPYVIVYDDNSVVNVIPKFCELVKKYKEAGKIPQDHEYPIKAIAWRAKDGQFGLCSYYKNYVIETNNTKIDYTNFKSYLFFTTKENSHKKSLHDVRKNIINALLKVLRLEQVKKTEGKAAFTVSSLMKYLKDNHSEFYDKFMYQLFIWCREVYIGRIEQVQKSLIEFIPILLGTFNKKIDKATDFVNNTNLQNMSMSAEVSDNNKLNDNVYYCSKTGIKVKIGTVHSVKGETHTATLYLESYYFQDGRGKKAKSFESQRLKEQFGGKAISPKAGDRTKQSAKMVYVGFSRPTHLLCFAVHKDRLEEKLFIDNGWQICKASQEHGMPTIAENSGGSA